MALRTRLTERLGIEHPVISAPMAFAAGGKLAAAVTGAGGLGLIGGGYGDADWLQREFTEAGNAKIGCGFITWSLAKRPELLEQVIARAPAAVMFSFLLEPTFGPYSRMLAALGLGHVDFFSSSLIMPTIVLIVVWEWTGYNMTILYTSLKTIPREITEAAVVSGASLRTIILRLKLPMVRPTLVMLVFINTVGALQLFTEPSIIASFEPQAVSFGFTPTLYVYNTAIGSGEYSLGAAAAVLLAVIIGLISLAGFAVRRRNGEFR